MNYFRLSLDQARNTACRRKISKMETSSSRGSDMGANKLREMFPSLDLEDKDPLVGGGIDKPRQSGRGHKPNPKYLG